MEFLDGPTLAKIQTQLGHFDALRAISVVVQIARGLYAAHQKGIIHRDLKPENIFVLSRAMGRTTPSRSSTSASPWTRRYSKKLTQVGARCSGTSEYMSPEQASGQPTDHRRRRVRARLHPSTRC